MACVKIKIKINVTYARSMVDLFIITSRVCGRGNVFVVSVCVEAVDIETSFLVWWYILTISRSSLSIKDIGSRSRSSHGNAHFATATLV